MHRAAVSQEIPGAREDVRGLDPGYRPSFMVFVVSSFVGFNRKTLDRDLTAGEVGSAYLLYRQLGAIVSSARHPIYN